MMDILKELHYGNIDKIYKKSKYPKSKADKELQIYDKLKERLSKEDNELFEKFIEMFGDRLADESEEKYIQGFKTAFHICIECFNLKLD